MFNYERIGEKIKGLSKVVFISVAIVIAVLGISLIVFGADGHSTALVLIGLLIAICGPIIAWISSWLLYGFGELIDKVCDIELNTRIAENKLKVQKESTKDSHEKSNKNTPSKENKKRFIIDNIVSNEIGENTWVCPECCRENSNDIIECYCGYKK